MGGLTMRRKDRIPLADGDEYDFLADQGEWRRYLCHSRQFLKWVKRKYNKRVRKHNKDRIKDIFFGAADLPNFEWEYIDDPDSPYEIAIYPEGKKACDAPCMISWERTEED